jgi:hypothetical protein
MVKVIDGKRYNTDTAVKIGENWNGLPPNDFNYCSENLYVTQNGNFFLCFNGGVMSKYSVSNGKTTTGNSGIIAMSKEDAFKFCQKNDEIETMEEYFADMVEDA